MMMIMESLIGLQLSWVWECKGHSTMTDIICPVYWSMVILEETLSIGIRMFQQAFENNINLKNVDSPFLCLWQVFNAAFAVI